MLRVLVAFSFATVALLARADEPLYRYEGDVLPYPDGGWHWGGCEPPCSESVENGRFILRWGELGRFVNYDRVIASTAEETPSSLWIEWRFRSNVPIPRFADDCDAHVTVDYRHVHDLVFPFGDAIVSFSGDDWLLGLALDEFHTYRFESPNGVDFWFSVDGLVFYATYDDHSDDGFHYLQFGGGGGCGETRPPDPRNEWDFVRYGTINYGEKIVRSDPPSGFVDARTNAPLDRFTVTFDEPNYVYIDEMTVNVSDGVAPAVIATRRLDNGPADVVEIVLDRPIPYNAVTRFTFNDSVAVNVVEFTVAPGDTDGDGDSDLFDFAVFQSCFGQSPLSPVCHSLDHEPDGDIDLSDFAGFQTLFIAP